MSRILLVVRCFSGSTQGQAQNRVSYSTGSHHIIAVQHDSEKPAKHIQKQTFSEPIEKILRGSCISDPELRKIVEIWPQLPEHIKAGIQALVQTHIEST